ncbi:Uncharacterised protein [Vibrio cholerae]|nr:Uncharacterised protein [Vibrio cholerae]CSI62693.1 Uncharacterised protein [Vibrio cholerae]
MLFQALTHLTCIIALNHAFFMASLGIQRFVFKRGH